MKQGIVYQSGLVLPDVPMGRITKILRRIAGTLIHMGEVCIGVAMVGIIYVYSPLVSAQVSYAVRVQTRELKDVQKPQIVTNPDKQEIGQNYTVNIPKIEAKAEVIKDVDIDDYKQYSEALKKGVAAAKGLSVPGQKGTTYLFAHSVGSRIDFARYNAVFYLLDKLELSDSVEITYEGKIYNYEVVDREILPASDTKYLVPQTISEKLVLQTCYPPGTTWKRLVVVAKRI